MRERTQDKSRATPSTAQESASADSRTRQAVKIVYGPVMYQSTGIASRCLRLAGRTARRPRRWAETEGCAMPRARACTLALVLACAGGVRLRTFDCAELRRAERRTTTGSPVRYWIASVLLSTRIGALRRVPSMISLSTRMHVNASAPTSPRPESRNRSRRPPPFRAEATRRSARAARLSALYRHAVRRRR